MLQGKNYYQKAMLIIVVAAYFDRVARFQNDANNTEVLRMCSNIVFNVVSYNNEWE